MKFEGSLFVGCAIFFGGADIVYWYFSKDPTGTTALALAVGLAFLTGFYLLFTGRRLPLRPEDNVDGEIEQFITFSVQGRSQHIEAESLGLRQFDFWRDREFMAIHDRVNQNRPVMSQGCLNPGRHVGGIFQTKGTDANGFGHFREIGVIESRAMFEQARGFHLQLDEAERAIVEEDDFHRQLELANGEEIAHQHGKTAIARKRDHLPPRKCQLRPDRLRHRICH